MIMTCVRTAVLYLVLILAVRLMGKRQLGQMEASEFVVTMLVANLASIPMEEPEIPISSGILPIGVILGVELLLSLGILKNAFLRRLLCGQPVLLIQEGQLCQKNMRRSRITLAELLSHLRQKDILDLSQVQFAILETDGNLSVFPYPSKGSQILPVTYVVDGKIQPKNLKEAGKDRDWLEKALQKFDSRETDTFYLGMDSAGKLVHIARE